MHLPETGPFIQFFRECNPLLPFIIWPQLIGHMGLCLQLLSRVSPVSVNHQFPIGALRGATYRPSRLRGLVVEEGIPRPPRSYIVMVLRPVFSTHQVGVSLVSNHLWETVALSRLLGDPPGDVSVGRNSAANEYRPVSSRGQITNRWTVSRVWSAHGMSHTGKVGDIK